MARHLPWPWFAWVLLAPACSLDWSKPKGLTPDGGGQVKDAGPFAPDGGEPPGEGGPSVTRCQEDSDCGSPERFQCRAGACEEYACHTSKPCPGIESCENHTCQAFVAPERFPASAHQSSGGGISSSSKYRMRWSAGRPGSLQAAKSSRFQLTVGVEAGRK
jgi:hypothetical protein